MPARVVAGLLFLAAAGGCVSPIAPSGLLRADALVAQGVDGCRVTLQVGDRRYEPIGLPDSLAVVGLQLRVEGVVVNRPSICMIGPGLELRSVTRKP